jgi:hypothetical protein
MTPLLWTALAVVSGTNVPEPPEHPYKPRRHRLGAAIGVASAKGEMTLGEHAGGEIGFLVRPGYAFRAVRGLELGADFGYLVSSTEGRALQVMLPSVLLRPYMPVGPYDYGEIGLSVRMIGAAAFVAGAPGPWTGLGLSVGPSVRMWQSRHLAFQFGGEFMFVTGRNPGIVGDIIFDPDGRLVSLTATFTILFGL